MKIFKKLIIALPLILATHGLVADTKVDELMKEGAEKIEASKKAAQDSMDKAVKKAAEDAKSAMMKLPSFSIDFLKKDEEEKEPDIDFQWTIETIRLAEEGDAARGEELAKAGKCAKCHGDNGVSEEDDSPSIAGQVVAYSFKQLHDYKVGLRENKQMKKKVKDLSLKDMADISTWYAKQTPEKKLGGDAPALAVKGDESRKLLSCDSCHNDDAAERGYQTPKLDGQKIEYFTDTMLEFKEGDRVNDHYSLMRALAAKLTEEEIEELAAYYSAKPAEDD